MKNLNLLVAILLVVGGLNWGLVGFFNFDLVAGIFGSASALSRIVYGIVGLSAIYYLVQMTSGKKMLSTETVTE